MIGRPMLPTAAVRRPAAVRIEASIWVVVVLPLVPVMPSQGTTFPGRLRRQANSTSLQIGTERAAAWASSGAVAGHPVVITRSASSGRVAVDPGPSRTLPPSNSSSVAFSTLAGVAASSSTLTRAPKWISPSAAANPETPTPATTTWACDQSEAPSAPASQAGLTCRPPIRRRRCRARRRRRVRR